jgi:hypothetical protein
MPALESTDGLSDVARRGLALYDARLKAQLEPEQNGRAIALNVDTGEYVVADTLAEARREMYRRYPHPDGRILSRIIGSEADEAMLIRLLGRRK